MTEKDEYDYSPMKSNVANLNFEMALKQKQQSKGKDLAEKVLLDNKRQTSAGKYGDSQKQENRNGSDHNLKKVHSIEDTESHQFEDSLMEQSSPHVDNKDMPYGNDQTSLNETTNIQLCNASGSYHVQQMTISSQDHNYLAVPGVKKPGARKKRKIDQKTAQHPKDGNFRNIKDYAMFIPNQPSVSQVQGKSRVFLAASDQFARLDGSSVSKMSKASTRQLVGHSDLTNLKMQNEHQASLRNQVSVSMNSHQASKKLSPSVSKAARPSPPRVANQHMNRSVI